MFKKNKIPVLVNSFKGSYDILIADKTKKYDSFIKSIRGGVAEMILHCGYDNEELKFITKHSGRRQADFDYAVSCDTKMLLKKENITLATWKEGVRLL